MQPSSPPTSTLGCCLDSAGGLTCQHFPEGAWPTGQRPSPNVSSSHSCQPTSEQMAQRCVWYQHVCSTPSCPAPEIRGVGSSNTLTKGQFPNRLTAAETESTGSEDAVGASYLHPCSVQGLLVINFPRKMSPPRSSWVTDSQAELSQFSAAPGSARITLHVFYYVYPELLNLVIF